MNPRQFKRLKRREFLQAAGIGVAATAVAKPAIAQTSPAIKWRLTSSFPKSLDTLYGAMETIAKFVSESTDRQFQMETFSAGEIVPGLNAMDAVSNGTVEACHTASYYYFGKDPTFALFCAVPFGLNTRQQNAWFYDGDGMKLMNEFGKKFNVYSLAAGNTGCQMGGWFRKEIKEVADINGLKFRIGGFAGLTIQKLGGVPQQIAGGDIYPALERGTIDAAEWVGPYDDEKLGFSKVAKYYYYPGWWEGATANHLMINLARWNELPKRYQSIVAGAAAYANAEELAKYDSRNPAALRKLIASGTELRAFSQPIMEAALKASNEVNAETAVNNSDFKKVLDSMQAFRNEEYFWWQVAEYGYDTFMIRTRPRA
ncbi:MAG TPA: TRAP transporter substrate-binding protein DctP [Xanthobacteraceae bacterium]|nr:TRAP transporter substrate-binding protein DctP [Xanthobacteraceae bacterium]